jgi:hypothetical protein
MALIGFSERFGMISAVTMNRVRKTICNQYVLTQLSATQLQRLQKTYVMAKRLQRLYLKREFEVALNQRFLRWDIIIKKVNFFCLSRILVVNAIGRVYYCFADTKI